MFRMNVADQPAAMTVAMKVAMTVVMTVVLGACSGGIVPGNAGAPGRPVQSAPPPPTSPLARFRAPTMQRGQGLQSVLGQSAPVLIRRFGQARIDLSEGDARKLQFVSSQCVLDIYLYPPSAAAVPVATHIEARLRKGGDTIDRARCIREVEAQR